MAAVTASIALWQASALVRARPVGEPKPKPFKYYGRLLLLWQLPDERKEASCATPCLLIYPQLPLIGTYDADP